MTVRIVIYDVAKQQWRYFDVDDHYAPRCGNGLHQFYPSAARCVCGAILAVPHP